MDRNTIAAEGTLAYHDYLLMLCFLDAEWSRRANTSQKIETSFCKAGNHFENVCEEYAKGIRDNWEKYCKSSPPCGNSGKDDIDTYLYSPLNYYPLGHADCLSMVLLDDFDPAHRLSAEMPTTVEDVTLAFCPTVESIDRSNGHAPLVDIHEAFKLQKAERTRRPLLSLTRMKIDGLGCIAEAMLFQQALFGAISIKLAEMSEMLRRHASLRRHLISAADIKSTRVVLLDLQGAEEIGVMMFCNNFSVAMTYIAVLRSLRFIDVFNADPTGSLKRALLDSDAHKLILSICPNKEKDTCKTGTVSLLEGKHAFRWTHSSLAVTSQSLEEPLREDCRGFAESIIEFQLAPGHREGAEESTRKAHKASATGVYPIYANREPLYRYQVGTGDMTVMSGYDVGATSHKPDDKTVKNGGARCESPRMLHLGAILDMVKHTQKACWDTLKKGGGRDVVDFNSLLTIPIPRMITEDGQNLLFPYDLTGHTACLSSTLLEIQRRLCMPDKELRDKKCERGIPHLGMLDIQELKNQSRKIGIPLSLRRSIEHLYQNFAIVIADPFLFDVVLDIYDTFATLHRLLTEFLPDSIKAVRHKYGKDVIPLLDRNRTDQLSMLVEALQNALMHRMAKAYPEVSIRDMAIDFRGGMNQILLAADAPVKCGIGLVRDYHYHSEKLQPDVKSNEQQGKGKFLRHSEIGVLVKIGASPGAGIYSLSFGAEEHVKLGFFVMDVPHVLHVDSYCETMHEAFHLIFDDIQRRGKANIVDENTAGKAMYERLAEVFASALSQLFVFGNDVKTFLYCSLISYCRNPTSMGHNNSMTVVRFTEHMIRLFLATDRIAGKNRTEVWEWPEESDCKPWPSPGSLRSFRRTPKDIDKDVARFKDMVKKVGPFFSDYARLFEQSGKTAVWEYCSKQFRAVYTRTFPYMQQLWTNIIDVYQLYYYKKLSKYPKYFRSEGFLDHTESMILQGKPIISALHCDEDASVDPLIVASQVLHSHLRTIREAENCRIHLERTPSKLQVCYPAGKLPWYSFQVDKWSTSMFSPVPSSRRDRLRKQIATLKTLWGVSSTLRAHRLTAIIRNNWSQKDLDLQEKSND